MSDLKQLKERIKEYPNNKLKDILIDFYEAIEWIMDVLEKERERYPSLTEEELQKRLKKELEQ